MIKLINQQCSILYLVPGKYLEGKTSKQKNEIIELENDVIYNSMLAAIKDVTKTNVKITQPGYRVALAPANNRNIAFKKAQTNEMKIHVYNNDS